jgi:predicted dehydrogenase
MLNERLTPVACWRSHCTDLPPGRGQTMTAEPDRTLIAAARTVYTQQRNLAAIAPQQACPARELGGTDASSSARVAIGASLPLGANGMTGTIAWGVIGTAGIALNKVIPGMLRGSRGTISAIASRSPEKAAEAAARFRIPKSYGSYEEILADAAIDAVYIPLPNHLHVPWALKALEAGKHVLCEKPIGLSAEEARALIDARDRSGRQVLEAFMVRQHPQWLRVQNLVRGGRIGDVRLVQTTMSFFNNDPNNVRNRADIGGGALYDIGCYAVLLARFVFGVEPTRDISLIDRDPNLRTDRLTSGIVDFGHGRQLCFSCSTQLIRHQHVQIFGTAGRIEVPVSLNAPPL